MFFSIEYLLIHVFSDFIYFAFALKKAQSFVIHINMKFCIYYHLCVFLIFFLKKKNVLAEEFVAFSVLLIGHDLTKSKIAKLIQSSDKGHGFLSSCSRFWHRKNVITEDLKLSKTWNLNQILNRTKNYDDKNQIW